MAFLKHRGQQFTPKGRRNNAECRILHSAFLILPFLMLCIFLTVSLFAPEAPGQLFKEYDVKARYLYHFAQFVEWPPEAFPTAESPVVIGILGTDPFGKILDDMMQNEVAKNRKLVVKRSRRVEEVSAGHILFISQSEEKRLSELLASLKVRNNLVVRD